MTSQVIPNQTSYVSVSRAAKILGLTTQTVRNRIAAGRLSAERRPGAYRISVCSLIECMESPSKPAARPGAIQALPEFVGKAQVDI